jgi:hypothetical protein
MAILNIYPIYLIKEKAQNKNHICLHNAHSGAKFAKAIRLTNKITINILTVEEHNKNFRIYIINI